MNTRAVLQGAAAVAAISCAASCSPKPTITGLGQADTSRPFRVSATNSVAAPFTAAADGQLTGVDLVANRYGHESVSLLAYLVTPNDPSGGDHPAAPPAASEAEPGCWGHIPNAVLPAVPRAIHIEGYACHVQAGHRYWIQFGTAAGAANLYPGRDGRVAPIATRTGVGSPWQSLTSVGGLDVAADIH